MDQPKPTPSVATAGPAVVPPISRGWSITVGVLLVLMGMIAIAFPFVSSIAVTLLAGWLLVISGILMIVSAFSAQTWGGTLWSGLMGILFVVAGALLIGRPLVGTLSLTLLLALTMIAEGIVKIIAAFSIRDRTIWGWVLFSGIIALLAGLSIAFAFPTSAIWVLGLLIGLNFIFSGLTFIMDPGEPAMDTRPPAP